VRFWKKDPLWEDLQNFVPKGFTTSQIHVLCANFVKFGRLEISKVVRYLLDKKKTKKIASLSRFCTDCTQNLPGQQQTVYLDCSKFHANQFTSGRVIAKCVNTIQTCHKVFPILGKAIASC